MANVRRFDSDISFNCIYADDGNLVRADEHLAAIAELNAEIERLRAALAEEQAQPEADVWQPMATGKQGEVVDCPDIRNKERYIWVHDGFVAIHETDTHRMYAILPDDVRLCRKVTP